jgi:hypothetical protein
MPVQGVTPQQAAVRSVYLQLTRETMAIFISYSHKDKAFVDRLAFQLVKARAPIWLDRWELNVGDSLLQRVQTALQDASALAVVLSRSSVESEWCKKELTSGLVRELEEKQVLVLPILLEDCVVPLFLRDNSPSPLVDPLKPTVAAPRRWRLRRRAFSRFLQGPSFCPSSLRQVAPKVGPHCRRYGLRHSAGRTAYRAL